MPTQKKLSDEEKLTRKLARMQATKERLAAAAAPCDESDPVVIELLKEARELKAKNELLRQKQLVERRVPPSVLKR